jgi:hypothetical protein
MASDQKKFVIHINSRRFEAPRSPMSVLELHELAGYDASYILFRLQGEGDPSGGEQLANDSSIELKNGLHFRGIPSNANFG